MSLRKVLGVLVVSALAVGGLLAARAQRARAGGGVPAAAMKLKHESAPLSADPVLAAAERAAIARLSEFRNALGRSEPGTLNFQVQAVVRVGDASERLWLADPHAVEGGFEAAIDSTPQILHSLQRGQTLHVWNEDVVDWAYDERGKPRGGETRRILAQQRRTAELNDALPKCIERKFADGCAVLGERYANGSIGEQRLDVARDLYARACEGGSAYGCNAAGWASLRARGGPQDLPAAAAFFARACSTGDEHPFACDSRGFALLTGLSGTARDLALGQRLLGKACARGQGEGAAPRTHPRAGLRREHRRASGPLWRTRSGSLFFGWSSVRDGAVRRAAECGARGRVHARRRGIWRDLARFGACSRLRHGLVRDAQHVVGRFRAGDDHIVQ